MMCFPDHDSTTQNNGFSYIVYDKMIFKNDLDLTLMIKKS
jgi:hypothetical protein